MRFFRLRLVMFLLPCRATFICDSFTARQTSLHARDPFSSTDVSGRSGGGEELASILNRSRVNPDSPRLHSRGRDSVCLSREHSRVARPSSWARQTDVSVNITSRSDFALTGLTLSRSRSGRSGTCEPVNYSLLLLPAGFSSKFVNGHVRAL